MKEEKKVIIRLFDFVNYLFEQYAPVHARTFKFGGK